MMSGIANFVAWGIAQPDSIPAPAVPRSGIRSGQILALLADGSGKTGNEMAAAIGITPGAAYQVVIALVGKKLIVSHGTRDKCKTWRVA